MAYDCYTETKEMQDAKVITTLADMPFACWVMTDIKGVGRVLYFRRINDDKAMFFQVDGEEQMWDAAAVFGVVSGVRLFYPSKIILKGDDRPIFNTEEEEKAYWEANPPVEEDDEEEDSPYCPNCGHYRGDPVDRSDDLEPTTGG